VIVLAGELDAPLLDRSDIEALANQVRTGLQVAINSARAALDAEGRGQVSTALRAVAFAVQEAAVAVINQRPPLVRRTSPVGGPVRLVAHQIYGDAARAAEISRLNSLGRHVYIERGDALNVYSA
jgi:prophage DNA circulation protein